MTYETIRRFAIVPFWTLYGRIHRGWRRTYAEHMLACSRKEKAWDSEMERLRRAAEKSRSPVPQACRLAALKLEYALFKGFCGADFRQDFADQLRNPFLYYARLVTNGRTRFVRQMLNGPEAFALCGNSTRQSVPSLKHRFHAHVHSPQSAVNFVLRLSEEISRIAAADGNV